MRDDLLYDSAGLGYSMSGGEVTVHYPRRDAATSGLVRGAGGTLTFVPPESYWTAPPNDATRERVEIWKRLKERAASD